MRAKENQRSLVIDILAASFDDNKSVNYVVKQDEKRPDRIRGLMEYSFNVCNAFGEVWLSEDEQACAMILLPDKKRANLHSIRWDARLAFSVIGLERISKVLGRESKIKAFHPKEPFTYLWFIGVRPEFQGQGKGSGMLQKIIEASVKNSRSVYLETSVERNLPWYKNHGFEIYNTLDLSYKLYLLRWVQHR